MGVLVGLIFYVHPAVSTLRLLISTLAALCIQHNSRTSRDHWGLLVNVLSVANIASDSELIIRQIGVSPGCLASSIDPLTLVKNSRHRTKGGQKFERAWAGTLLWILGQPPNAEGTWMSITSHGR